MDKGIKTCTIIMVGDSGIGKTMLAEVFTKGRGAFSEIYITTAGVDLCKKTILIDGERINLKIWDLSGANEYRTRITYQFKDADAIMLCYSVTSQESWENLNNWITTIIWQIGAKEFDTISKLIVGLKYDLPSKVVKDEDVAVKCSNLPNSEALLTSSKKFIGVQEAFYSLVSRIYARDFCPTPSVQQEPKRSRCNIL